VRRAPHVEDLLREAAPQVLGAVVRRFRDFAEAEDAVQEALLAAAQQWPAQGVPESPVGWLIHVASRRMVDRIRAESARREREEAVAALEPADPPQADADADDTLLLMVLCCDPALTPASAIALALRAVGGLTTTEIAAAFLVPEATMAQRISRAKQALKRAGTPFGMPSRDEWPARLRSVLHVLYLMFNEGYVASSGRELARADLSAEAIRLTRPLRAALPGEPEVAGLLALMLLTEARRQARTDEHGALVPLDEQDRARWDQALIAEGTALVADALAQGRVGEYQLQAAIAAVHDRAPTAQDTDWRQILMLYGLLEQITGNPMVSLNRAIAAAMADGPAAGLALLEPLAEPLTGHHRLHAARGHLLELAGDAAGAIAEYDAAAARTTSAPEQQYLLRRAARLRGAPGPPA
jgi:RNA polymerase sigma factor (sigma-70 family)